MPLLPFATRSVNHPEYSGERLLNCYPRMTQGAAAQITLVGTKGLQEVSGLTPRRVRALEEWRGRLVAVSDGAAWLWDNGTVTRLGPVPDHRDTTIATGHDWIAVSAGGGYFAAEYADDMEDALTQVVPGALSACRTVCYMNGFFVLAGRMDNRNDVMQLSAPDNAGDFDALDFATAESHADDIRAVLQDHGELLVFGDRSIESWSPVSGTFPFARNGLSGTEIGCIAGTVAQGDNGVFWVGDDGMVYRRAGGAPAAASPAEVAAAIAADTITSAFTFDEAGHKFYAVRLATAPAQVYDITTGVWHERSSGTSGGPWCVTSAARIGTRQYLGTCDGRIAQFSTDWAEFGNTLVMEATSAPEVAADRFRVSRVHVNFSDGQGTAPEVALEVSADGRTWSAPKRGALAPNGQYHRRVAWHGLGAKRRFQARLRITDNVQRDIVGVEYA